MIFYRDRYVERLASMRWNGLVKVITGTRRAGKSYLLNELFYRFLLREGVPKERIIRFAFDSDEDIDRLDAFADGEAVKIKDRRNGYFINAKVFRRYIASLINEEESFYLFLDEVQMLENFVGTLNSYLRHHNLDVYATGLNSKFLSSDIATEFKGRSCELHVQPLTFSEYVNGRGEDIHKAWADYIVTGGIPLVAAMQDEEQRIQYLKNLTTETYLKDIIQRNEVRKKQELSDTFDILASTISSPVNPNKIANTFKSLGHGDISSETISRFIDHFCDAFVIRCAGKYNIKGRKYIDSPFKIYFEDIGVRNARLNFRQIEETHIMENILYNELRYRGFNVDVGEMNITEDTGRKDKNNHAIYARKSLEVDFIATLGSRKYYLQSALSMDLPEKQMQEKKSLYYIDDSFKKIVVTRNGLKVMRDEKGIMTIDLFDFLMNDDSLDY
ncbi:MAG: ATP-binding protein [Clostridiales bacterium]|nr:ATP-binding protein [Clostridiales bacterium]